MKTVSTDVLSLIEPKNMERNLDLFSKISSSSNSVSRLAYSSLERQSHDYFSDYMHKLGLRVWTDSAGNTMAQYPRESQGEEQFLATGSHLDSVPEGGKYDGIVGVVAAMEIARVLSESNAITNRPWRFVVFAGEEGARFGQACNGSRAIAGLTESNELESLLDLNGVSMSHAMKEVGLDPERISESVWTPYECAGFIELHIEQGNVLESESLSVGIVDVISGSSRLLVTVTGVAAHSGGTPMSLRKDALLTAAQAIVKADSFARDSRNAGIRVTVGRLTTFPGSITTIPGWVQFTVDIRDFESGRQGRIVEELSEIMVQTGIENGTDVNIESIGNTTPIHLTSRIVERIEQISISLSLKSKVLPSGASHDCQQMSTLAESGLIFISSRGGHSHMPEEFSSIEDLAIGTKLLFASLLDLDHPSV